MHFEFYFVAAIVLFPVICKIDNPNADSGSKTPNENEICIMPVYIWIMIIVIINS